MAECNATGHFAKHDLIPWRDSLHIETRLLCVCLLLEWVCGCDVSCKISQAIRPSVMLQLIQSLECITDLDKACSYYPANKGTAPSYSGNKTEFASPGNSKHPFSCHSTHTTKCLTQHASTFLLGYFAAQCPDREERRTRVHAVHPARVTWFKQLAHTYDMSLRA